MMINSKTRRRSASAVLALSFAVPMCGIGIAAASPVAAIASQPSGPVHSDFNGDGVGDLAIGVPYEDLRGLADAGAVNVIYGTSSDGLTSAGNQLWTENSAGILGDAESGDRFGLSVATGDFDGDGFGDLAVGSPYEDAGAGMVHVLYGTSTGLGSGSNQLWSQDTPGIEETTAANDFFSWALTVGDFDADGFADLAVGVPGEDLVTTDVGAVNVIYGSATGLTTAGDQLWSQQTADIEDDPEASELFGTSLAAGDFNADGSDDLAIGVPYESLGTSTGLAAGAVNVIYGSSGEGLVPADDQFWSQNSDGILGLSATADHFGASLATGDFSGDGTADLAIGVPGEESPGHSDVGAVNVIYGSSNRLVATRNQLWRQGSGGLLGSSNDDDLWGTALVAADFGKNSHADLAVGGPGESSESGAVSVIYGGRGGLQSAGNQQWTQDSTGIFGVSEPDDLFGGSLAAANLGRTAYADLVIGVTGDTFLSVDDAGAVNVIYGSSTGMTAAGNQLWAQDSAGIAGTSVAGERFGHAVGAGGG